MTLAVDGHKSGLCFPSYMSTSTEKLYLRNILEQLVCEVFWDTCKEGREDDVPGGNT